MVTQLREKYGDDVRVVFRHLAMQFHKNAGLAAEAAIAAADQGKFWAFHDQVWAHFGQLTRADLESFAQAAGLDLGAFRAALDQRRYRDLVVAEGATALALGVDGTPTMFVNGQPVVGARDFATMDTIVAAHLTRAKQAIAAGVPSGDIYALLMSDALGVERADPRGCRIRRSRRSPCAPRIARVRSAPRAAAAMRSARSSWPPGSQPSRAGGPRSCARRPGSISDQL